MEVPGWMPAIAIGMSLAGTPVAAEGDAENGGRLAEQWCSGCHDISPDGPFKRDPPSFAAIAVYRSADQIFSRISLPVPHHGMPRIGQILDLEAIDDLVAYIAALEQPFRQADGVK